MSEESVPLRFPLLRLPYLCIEAVILNSEVCDLINFSYISKRTNRLVKSFKSPVSHIVIRLDQDKSIILKPMQFVLELKSTDKLKNLIELFKCSVDYLNIDGDHLTDPINFDFNFKKINKLFVGGKKEIENHKLKHLMEQFEVSDGFILACPISKDFHCDPKLFEAKFLVLAEKKSAGWVTGDYLSQLGNIHRFDIDYPQFGIKDVVEFITRWFNSIENTTLKAFTVVFENPFSPEDLVLDHLQPMRWDPERRPATMINPWITDLSNGLDILRSDGQLATILADDDYVIFHVWLEREMRGLPYR
ncbi:unnamed protein product [Caenorhabditis brenneri]